MSDAGSYEAPRVAVLRACGNRRLIEEQMKIERRFTKAGQDPYADIEFRQATSEIRNPDGSVVFRLDDIEVPRAWSQVATDILAQKYFRKAGVPGAPEARRGRNGPVLAVALGGRRGGARRAAREGAHRRRDERQAGLRPPRRHLDLLGLEGRLLRPEDDARAFYDEHALHARHARSARPTRPQWFNTGLHWAYGIDGPGQGHYYVDHETGELTESTSAYEHPQPHACFIQSVEDDLVNEGGIMDLWVREARLFKYGSGTGSNFSTLRGENEPLSGGGKSSGLMSFLKIGDRAAGAIKSGGTTRRAAKMVVVDVDHPDIEEYIDWKVNEEQKVAALVTGSKIVQAAPHGDHEGLRQLRGPAATTASRSTKNPALQARRQGRPPQAMVPENYIQRVIQFARQGYTEIEFATYDTDWDSEAYRTVSGQNSNNSVRVTDEFLRAVESDGDWTLDLRASTARSTKTAQGPRAVGQDRPRRLGLRRSRHPVPHHHQRLAHLPGVGRDPRLEPVLGVHVPRRHGLQPGLAEPDAVPRRRDGQVRHRRLRACHAAVDDGARDLGADGAVPVARRSPSCPTSTARWAWASPTSAAC